ncbi:MAG: lipocalin-like domain-containing protein [Nitrososphaeria archaeon]
MSFEKFIGTWKLVSYKLELGDKVSYPFGEDAIGYIIYNPDGYMAAFLAPKRRIKFGSADMMGGTADEKIAAADTFISYCGSFEVSEDLVVHRVEASFFPNWVGSRQERFYKFEGDRLTLSTAPMLVYSKMQSAHLIWERVKSKR